MKVSVQDLVFEASREGGGSLSTPTKKCGQERQCKKLRLAGTGKKKPSGRRKDEASRQKSGERAAEPKKKKAGNSKGNIPEEVERRKKGNSSREKY